MNASRVPPVFTRVPQAAPAAMRSRRRRTPPSCVRQAAGDLAGVVEKNPRGMEVLM